MEVSDLLLDRAMAIGARSVAVVGTGKNVGKTVVMRAIYRAALARGMKVGLTSIGRDGEANDFVDAFAKPRLRLAAGTLVAGALGALPRSPALEWCESTEIQSASGPIAIVRVRTESEIEVVGAPTASGLRGCVAALFARGAEFVAIDGAIDRIAALRGEDAVIVSCGAAGSTSVEAIAAEAGALVALLALPRHDDTSAALQLEGALTPMRAAELIARGERRAIVVRDATRVTLRGRALLGALDRLQIRVERPLHPVAVTVNSVGRAGSVEPKALLHAVRAAVALPTFDLFAASAA
ncbi:MAG: hypothetical protein HKL91_03320 [Candidatus Eremiobacteraeota bacterium]|uniref:Uncharacterized protein n=1 Tax=mine drainage metagenome TaxID=410659 RepID=E6PFW0_9ZZZZ|nr:hypothetical protein [Candidatus Eremiobacteraeota bacterium]